LLFSAIVLSSIADGSLVSCSCCCALVIVTVEAKRMKLIAIAIAVAASPEVPAEEPPNGKYILITPENGGILKNKTS